MRENILIIGGDQSLVEKIREVKKSSKNQVFVRCIVPINSVAIEIDAILKNIDFETVVMFCGTAFGYVRHVDAVRACKVLDQKPEEKRPKVILLVSQEESHYFRQYSHVISGTIYLELTEDQKTQCILSHFQELEEIESL